MRGVRMHCEQSRVGKVSESCAMWPPIEASFSTSTTSWPPSAMSSAAWMPAMPPPMTMARLVTGMRIVSSGTLCLTFSAIVRAVSIALTVAASRSSWIHEQCSRMLAISQRNGLSPACDDRAAEGLLVHVRRAGGDDDPGEPLVDDGALDERLAGVGAHVLVVLGVGDARVVGERPGHGGAVDRAGDVLAAVADEDADPGHQSLSFAVATAAASEARRGSASTKWRARPSSAGERPIARPTSSVM